MEYKRFTDEERQKAKNTDMIAFLESYMGFEFKKVGKYYQCRQHDSLMIYPDRQGFSWNSRNILGSDAIDFLRNFEVKNPALQNLLHTMQKRITIHYPFTLVKNIVIRQKFNRLYRNRERHIFK